MPDIIRPTAQEAIIDAAFTVLGKDPSAPLSEIAARAGVGRATLHRYYASRAELISALSHIAIKEMDEVAEAACADAQSHSEALQLSFQALVPLGDRYGFLMLEDVANTPDIEQEIERQQRETNMMVDAAKEEGVFGLSVPTGWITKAYDNLLYAAWDSVHTGEMTNTQASDYAWRTLTKGLGGKL